MDLVSILIWVVLAAIAFGIVIIAAFGIKNLASGKFRIWSIAAMLLPVVLFFIIYAINSGADYPATTAVIVTAMVMMVAGVVAIAVTSLKGFLGF